MKNVRVMNGRNHDSMLYSADDDDTDIENDGDEINIKIQLGTDDEQSENTNSRSSERERRRLHEKMESKMAEELYSPVRSQPVVITPIGNENIAHHNQRQGKKRGSSKVRAKSANQHHHYMHGRRDPLVRFAPDIGTGSYPNNKLKDRVGKGHRRIRKIKQSSEANSQQRDEQHEPEPHEMDPLNGRLNLDDIDIIGNNLPPPPRDPSINIKLAPTYGMSSAGSDESESDTYAMISHGPTLEYPYASEGVEKSNR